MIIPHEEFQQFGMGIEDLSQLTDSCDGTVDSDIYASVHDMAVGELEGFVRGIYATPIDNPSRFVKSLIANIITYRLYVRRNPADVPDKIIKQYENVIKLLGSIRSRKVVLDLPLAGSEAGDTDERSPSSMIIQKQSTAKFPRDFTQA